MASSLVYLVDAMDNGNVQFQKKADETEFFQMLFVSHQLITQIRPTSSVRHYSKAVEYAIQQFSLVNFQSAPTHIDTANAAGRLMGHILGALAEFGRSLIVDRTQAGLKAAKKRGVKLGRRPALSDDQRKHARELLAKGESPAVVASYSMSVALRFTIT
ncbi:recombinase family protein [Methylobacter tundripaludum]